jgi:hypothetical protein
MLNNMYNIGLLKELANYSTSAAAGMGVIMNPWVEEETLHGSSGVIICFDFCFGFFLTQQ